MFVGYREAASRDTCAAVPARVRRRSQRQRRDGERGAALVEFALVVPIMMILVFAMASFGFLLNQDLALTEATNIGGKQFSITPSYSTDPCASVSSAVLAASPYLNSSNTGFSFTFNGGAPLTFAAGTSPTCASEAAVLAAVTTGTVYPLTLKVTYSCAGVISFSFGSLYKFNPLPASSCSLSSQITEILQ
jgi:Flp pilus assembly protein TadG